MFQCFVNPKIRDSGGEPVDILAFELLYIGVKHLESEKFKKQETNKRKRSLN